MTTPRRCHQCHRVVTAEMSGQMTVRVCSLGCYRRLTKIELVVALTLIADQIKPSRARDIARTALRDPRAR